MTDFNINDQGAPQGGGQDSGSGINPAWGEMLGAVPQELHSQVIPHLQKWDEGVRNKLTEVQSKYKPFDEFASQGVTPEHIQEALGVVQALRSNPEMVWKQLGDRFGYGQQQQPVQDQGQQEPDDIWGDLPPQLQQKLQGLIEEHDTLREVAGTMAQILVGQQQTTAQADEDAKIDAMYQGLMESDPVFKALNDDGSAEPYINSLLMADVSPEDALKAYHAHVDKILKTAGRAPSPRILGPGGAIPGNNLDVKKATSQQVRQLVANMIADSAAE